ncbi:MetQ/NlpA family ABC transporter substrate-binding protein [Aerococcus christensenii]|uniref:MetQ/NlpA family ABC transporter substrate-binding protein n=1 Tax=Aerococcus christensenii TaxID=87541 RepID=UPI001C60CA19|nr:MetQ/NlpA family ABC transporter substrate-binding protein [Aerococcus christensenii]
MLFVSMTVCLIFSIPLGILLFSLNKKYLIKNTFFYQLLSILLNMLRSIPFLIFIFILIPINRFLFKTAFGNLAATLPLALVSISIYTRFVEQALQNVDSNIIDNESFTATEKDIVENKKKVKLVKVSLLNLNEAYKEKDLAFNYPDKISKLGLNPKDNAVIKEEKADQNYYALSLVARDDNKDDKGIEALKKALTSDKVKKIIEEKYKGIYSPAF